MWTLKVAYVPLLRTCFQHTGLVALGGLVLGGHCDDSPPIEALTSGGFTPVWNSERRLREIFLIEEKIERSLEPDAGPDRDMFMAIGYSEEHVANYLICAEICACLFPHQRPANFN